MSLETLLRDAADGDVTFQPDDVHDRVRRWQRRRRALAGLGVIVLLAAGAAGVVALTGDDAERSIITGPSEGEPQPVPITEAALVGSRWVVDPTVEGTTVAEWIEFEADGTYTGAASCLQLGGTWALERELVLSPGPSRLPYCPLLGALAGQATLRDDGSLTFEGRIERLPVETAVLHRLDELGSPATAENLVGTWVSSAGLPITFGPELEIDGCPFGVWQVDGTGLRVSGSTEGLACPNRTHDEQSVTEAYLWVTSTSEARVVDDELLLATTAATIRLHRAGTTVTAADLTASPWLATEVGLEVLAVPRLRFDGDGSGEPQGSSFQLNAGCTTWSGTWRLAGNRVHLIVMSHAIGFCTQEQEVERGASIGLASDEVMATVDGDELVISEGAATIVFRPLGSFPAPTRAELVGPWRTPDGFAVTFEEAGGVSAEAYSCRSGGWQLDGATLLITDRGQNCTFPNTSPVFGLLAPADVLSIGLDGNRLYLTDGATVAVLDRAATPPMAPNAAEHLMIEAIADLGAEQCCAEPSHGGDDATVGFTMSGYDFLGYAAPLVGSLPPDLSDTRTLEIGAVMGEDAEGTVIAFACGGFRITLREFTALEEIPSDVLQSAATGLIRALPCAAVPDPA